MLLNHIPYRLDTFFALICRIIDYIYYGVSAPLFSTVSGDAHENTQVRSRWILSWNNKMIPRCSKRFQFLFPTFVLKEGTTTWRGKGWDQQPDNLKTHTCSLWTRMDLLWGMKIFFAKLLTSFIINILLHKQPILSDHYCYMKGAMRSPQIQIIHLFPLCVIFFFFFLCPHVTLQVKRRCW